MNTEHLKIKTLLESHNDLTSFTKRNPLIAAIDAKHREILRQDNLKIKQNNYIIDIVSSANLLLQQYFFEDALTVDALAHYWRIIFENNLKGFELSLKDVKRRCQTTEDFREKINSEALELMENEEEILNYYAELELQEYEEATHEREDMQSDWERSRGC